MEEFKRLKVEVVYKDIHTFFYPESVTINDTNDEIRYTVKNNIMISKGIDLVSLDLVFQYKTENDKLKEEVKRLKDKLRAINVLCVL